MANWKFWKKAFWSKDNAKEIGKDISNGIKQAGKKGIELGKGAGAAVIKKVFGAGTVENTKTLKFWKGDFWQKDNLKGVTKGGIVLGAMITVGILAGPIGWFGAAVLAIGAGVAVPKVASLLGFKGFEKSSETRKKERLNILTPERLKNKKQEFKKSASWKKKLGIGAICAAVLVTIVTGGAAWPLILGGLALSAPALYSSSKDNKKADALEGINDKSTSADMEKAALAAGLVKEKDLEKSGIDVEKVKNTTVEKDQNQQPVVQPQVDKQAQVDAQVNEAKTRAVAEGRKHFEAEDLLKTNKFDFSIDKKDLDQSAKKQEKIQQNKNAQGLGSGGK